jgi:hypothetical protein
MDLIREIREHGAILYSRTRAIERLAEHEMTMVDVANALRCGVIETGERDDDDRSYCVCSERHHVIVQFLSQTQLRIVTAWRAG